MIPERDNDASSAAAIANTDPISQTLVSSNMSALTVRARIDSSRIIT